LKRKLVLLNLVLTALLAAAGYQIREKWIAGKRYEAEVLARAVPQAPAPVVPADTPAEPVQAAQYLDVATRMVFSQDRNPTVVIEVPKPVPEPPLPVVYGVMDLGFGATIFMSEQPGQPQKGYKQGDKIGEYKLVKATRTDLELEWNGKLIPKTVAELKVKAPPPQAPASAGNPGQPPLRPDQAPPVGTNEVTDEAKVAEAQKAKSEGNPWVNTGGVNHACTPNDGTPAGAVINGFRKVVKQSMFGASCFWEPVR